MGLLTTTQCWIVVLIILAFVLMIIFHVPHINVRIKK
jgi:hypothetical protein